MTSLTPREAEVVRELMTGDCDKVIARRLGISHYTVKCHCFKIYRKIGVHSRLEVVCRLLHQVGSS